MMRLLNGLMTSIAEDEARNDYERRIQIHERLSAGRHLARADWIDWIYRALFLMPLDDPWLGLVDAHAFDGLPKNAVRGASPEDAAADGGR